MWERLKRWARQLESEGMALWFCCRHPGMPWLPKVFALLVVGYFLSPIDLIPDFIPVLGYLDELILVGALKSSSGSARPGAQAPEIESRKSNFESQNGLSSALLPPSALLF